MAMDWAKDFGELLYKWFSENKDINPLVCAAAVTGVNEAIDVEAGPSLAEQVNDIVRRIRDISAKQHIDEEFLGVSLARYVEDVIDEHIAMRDQWANIAKGISNKGPQAALGQKFVDSISDPSFYVDAMLVSDKWRLECQARYSLSLRIPIHQTEGSEDGTREDDTRGANTSI